jgi:hypothetical protein
VTKPRRGLLVAEIAQLTFGIQPGPGFSIVVYDKHCGHWAVTAGDQEIAFDLKLRGNP